MATTLALFFLAAGAWAQGLQELAIAPTEPTGSHHNALGPAAIDADRIALRELIGFVYGVSPVRVLGPNWLNDTFQVTAKARAGEENEFLPALQEALAGRLHVRIERTAKEMQIYVLKVVNPDSLKLHPGSGTRQISGGDGNLSFVNAPISDLENFGTRILGRPVIDATGLLGGYTFDLEWRAGDVKSLAAALREQLGLALADERRKVDVLMVDRVP
jgi:uncharacterized protein (TIGR03435 family)